MFLGSIVVGVVSKLIGKLLLVVAAAVVVVVAASVVVFIVVVVVVVVNLAGASVGVVSF